MFSRGAVRNIDQSLISNRLWKALSLDDFGMLGSHLTTVDLPRGYIGSMPGQPVEHSYFLGSQPALIITTYGVKRKGGNWAVSGLSASGTD